MTDEQNYSAQCSCSEIEVTMDGPPKVRGFCHCEDCRELLNLPYHSVNAWEKDKVEVKKGAQSLLEYQHPRLNMKKLFCKACGDVVYNTNGMDWRVFSQLLMRKSYGGTLPDSLTSKSHFFYARRIIDVDDGLPKRD